MLQTVRTREACGKAEVCVVTLQWLPCCTSYTLLHITWIPCVLFYAGRRLGLKTHTQGLQEHNFDAKAKGPY